MAEALEQMKASVGEAEKKAAESGKSAAEEVEKKSEESAKSTVSLAEKLAEKGDTALPAVQSTAESLLSRGIDAAKTVVQSLEEHKGELTSKMFDAAAKPAHGGASSEKDPGAKEGESAATEAGENQPLVSLRERNLETASWKNCCGILECLRSSDR